MHSFFARVIFFFGLMAMAAAFYGWVLFDLWLASTQWLLISANLLLVSVFVRMSEDDDRKIEKERAKKTKSKPKSKPKKKAKTKKETGKKNNNHASFKLTE